MDFHTPIEEEQFVFNNLYDDISDQESVAWTATSDTIGASAEEEIHATVLRLATNFDRLELLLVDMTQQQPAQPQIAGAIPMATIQRGYTVFSDQAWLLMYENWFEAGRLLQALNAMQRLNFCIQNSRASMLIILNQAIVDCPYAQDKRFPVMKIFVCESTGDWANKFIQLRAALDFKDSSKDPKASGPGTGADYNDNIYLYIN